MNQNLYFKKPKHSNFSHSSDFKVKKSTNPSFRSINNKTILNKCRHGVKFPRETILRHVNDRNASNDPLLLCRFFSTSTMNFCNKTPQAVSTMGASRFCVTRRYSLTVVLNRWFAAPRGVDVGRPLG